jgi:hypothetical protein
VLEGCKSAAGHQLGWQPSRFLTARTEAERAFQLAEQLGSVNAAAAELGTTWPSLRKAFARHGLGMPARNLSRRTGHHGRVPDVPEVDDDQRAALRRLRAAFGAIQIIKVISNDPTNEARMADPRRMTPEEQGEAHALLVTAVSDPDWQAARQALDELMRKLAVVHRLLEAEERLAKREPPAEPP